MNRWKKWSLMLICLLVVYTIRGILVPEATAVVSQSRIEASTNKVYAPLKVVTYNIHIGKDTMGHLNLEHTIQTLREIDADIIGLQEVERNSPRSQFVDEPAKIAEALGMEYHFEPGMKVWKFEFGNVLLSKYPIRTVQRIDLPSTKENRVAIVAHLDIAGKDVAVLVTHLGLNQQERVEHAQILADALKQIEVPVIVMGDFNTTPDSEELSPLWQYVKLSADEPLVTFPGLNRQIDLIMNSQRWEPQKSYIVNSTASDHLPLVTELLLNADQLNN